MVDCELAVFVIVNKASHPAESEVPWPRTLKNVETTGQPEENVLTIVNPVGMVLVSIKLVPLVQIA